ncbi:MAG: hypothetical protein WDA59_09550 [Methanofastidiosum sp.]
MGKYWGYFLVVAGLILLAGKLYSLFYFSNLYNTMPNCAYNDFECLQMRHYVGHQMLRSMVWAFFGIIVTYWGWNDLHKPKYQIKDDKELRKIADNAAKNFLDKVPKYTPIIFYPDGTVKTMKPQYDDYMEKISVLNLLKENPQITKEEIRGITNFDELEIELAIKDLIDEGRILDTEYGFELLKN